MTEAGAATTGEAAMAADARRWHAEDARARAEALDPGRSFLLQAPAGSGKTTVLTCRLLALLAVANEPEEVLAITFTRKAAAEMRARVLRALWRAHEGRVRDPHEAGVAAAALQRDGQRGWGLLRNPSRLRIQTIDAFCQRLATQLPVSSRAGGGRELALPATTLYRSAARRVLGRALADPVLREGARSLFVRLDNDWSRLERLLVLMLGARSHWLPRLLGGEADLAARVGGALRALVGARLAALQGSLDAGLLAEGARLCSASARHLADAGGATRGGPDSSAHEGWLAADGAPGSAPEQLPRWRYLAWLLLTGSGDWRRKWDKNTGVPPKPPEFKRAVAEWAARVAGEPGRRAALAELLELPDPALSPDDAGALAGLSLLLQHAAAELEIEFAQRGRVDHVAVAGAARAALSVDGAPTDLALRCGEAIRHILIDEFQDTSLEQFELLRALTAGWSAGDGRTLFAVGDPMQSIYQFREAEVGLFLQAREQGIGGLRLESLQLRRNFRSAPEVIDWVNAACSRVFPASDDPWLAAISYLPALAGRGQPGGRVQVHAMQDGDPAVEAACIAARAVDERRRSPDCSIAVLLPARRHAAPIAVALRAAGLAVRGVKLEPLAERPVVRDLGALARALCHLGDRTAWLALLRAPWCGLPLPQLQALAEGEAQPLWARFGEAGVLAALDASARTRLGRLRAALLPAIEGADRQLPLGERVERAWLRLGGPATCESQAELVNAEAYLRALDEEREAEWPAGDAADGLVAELYADAEPVAGAVEILTVHAAKGLEWDVVFLPALGRSGRSDDKPLLEWLDMPAEVLPGGLLLAPMLGVGELPPRSLVDYIAGVKQQRRRLERARLLYVAATRAKHSLHWIGFAPTSPRTGELQPRGGTSLALLWPVLEPAFLAAGTAGVPAVQPAAAQAASNVQESAPCEAPGALLRLAADFNPQGLPGPVPATRLAVGAGLAQEAPEYLWVGLAARLVGTLVHAELQRLSAHAAMAGSLPEGASLRAADYLPRLAELGLVGEAARPAAQRIVAALAATLADARGRWLLGEGGGEAHSELRLAGLHEGRVLNISIDRVRADPQGERWIIDYKTGTHEGGDLEAFLASEAIRHAPQLARYRSMATSLWGGPLRTALYFPLLGQFREVITG
jgi:ATP-dependent exoDNAse (exonuclease V) beta subunit